MCHQKLLMLSVRTFPCKKNFLPKAIEKLKGEPESLLQILDLIADLKNGSAAEVFPGVSKESITSYGLMQFWLEYGRMTS